MPTERLSMRKTREILRLKWVLRRSHREIQRALGIGLGTISDTATRAAAQQLDWAAIEALTDDALETRLYPSSTTIRRPLPSPARMHLELRRPGVTLRLLHEEYLAAHPDGYAYTQFVGHYRTWAAAQRVTMRQIHRAGDKVFVDYSGKRPAIFDPTTGERTEVELFVAVLGASNYTFVEATFTQQLRDWIVSHVRAFEFFGGVPRLIVPDNLKSGVTKACRYDPTLNRTYAEMIEHYDTAALPARPRKPRDKAKVEVGVQIVERWILARLRKQTFFTLADLNAAIRPLIEQLNHKPFKKLPGSRHSQFEAIERAALKPLPLQAYQFAEWKKARVHIDYHVEVDGHYYSVPHALIKRELDVRITLTAIECYLNHQRVAVHPRAERKGGHSTIAEHMPKSHRAHLEWTPGRFLNWAIELGPCTRDLVQQLLTGRPHPEMGFRSCLGLLSLEKRFGKQRLEAACERAIALGSPTRRSVLSLLEKGLDSQPLPESALPEPAAELPFPGHENIRGSDYYQ